MPGAGAVEIELAHRITEHGNTLSGLEQYAVKKFGTALESFVKTLADNSGVKSNEVISKLYAAHSEGNKNAGFDINVSVGSLLPYGFSKISQVLRNL